MHLRQSAGKKNRRGRYQHWNEQFNLVQHLKSDSILSTNIKKMSIGVKQLREQKKAKRKRKRQRR